MKINDIDISKFKALLESKDIQTSEIKIYNDWLRNASNYIVEGKEEKYISIKCKFVVQGETEQKALENISNLIKNAEICTLKFDNVDFYYDAILVNKTSKRVIDTLYEVQIDWKSGYAYKSQLKEIMDNISKKTILVEGNIMTPAIIKVTVPIDKIDLKISGFGENIIIRNLKAGIPVIINGENCTVLENGKNKYKDTEMWEFPKLNFGMNTISVNDKKCHIEICYKPKWI